MEEKKLQAEVRLLKQEIEKLKKMESQFNEVLNWVNERKKQIIPFPLDVRSIDELSKIFLKVDQSGTLLQTTASSDFISGYIKTKINNKEVILTYPYGLTKCLVNSSNDTITANNDLVDGQTVTFYSTQEIASGLDTASLLYVINRTATTFKVSLSAGGSAVNITDNGKGDQYFQPNL